MTIPLRRQCRRAPTQELLPTKRSRHQYRPSRVFPAYRVGKVDGRELSVDIGLEPVDSVCRHVDSAWRMVDGERWAGSLDLGRFMLEQQKAGCFSPPFAVGPVSGLPPRWRSGLGWAYPEATATRATCLSKKVIILDQASWAASWRYRSLRSVTWFMKAWPAPG